MKEEPNEYLLDRDMHISDAKTHYHDILEVMGDMSNYGSNLIPRCFTISKRGLDDAIVLGIFLKQSVSMFDAIEILLSNAAVYPSHLQERALFEVSIYLEWMLKDNTLEKAKYYYVANLRQERLWALRTQDASEENNAFKNLMEPLGDYATNITIKLEGEGKKLLEQIDKLLSNSEYASINKAIESYKTKKKLNYDPPWYAPFGPSSVRQLAAKLKRLHEYEIFYSQSSQVMHATRHKDHVLFKNGFMHFQPIRYLEGISTVLLYSISMMMKIHLLILDHYRPDERTAYRKKYVEDWRKPFRNIKIAKYYDANESDLII